MSELGREIDKLYEHRGLMPLSLRSALARERARAGAMEDERALGFAERERACDEISLEGSRRCVRRSGHGGPHAFGETKK